MTREAKQTKRQEMAEKREPSGRKKRIPLGRLRAQLTLEGLQIPPNKVPRWFVGEMRARQAEAAGYTYVEDPNAKVGEGPENQRDPLNTKVSRIVDREKGTRAYLMVIDKDWYKEDQREKQKQVDEIDDAIHHGNIGGTVGHDGRYVPEGGISYKP